MFQVSAEMAGAAVMRAVTRAKAPAPIRDAVVPGDRRETPDPFRILTMKGSGMDPGSALRSARDDIASPGNKHGGDPTIHHIAQFPNG